jgi:hypothetical protein
MQSQPSPLTSAAAAAAALRTLSPTSPTDVSQVQTKRNLQRQASRESIGNGGRQSLHRRLSSGSMSERTFRSTVPTAGSRPGSSGGSRRAEGLFSQRPPTPPRPPTPRLLRKRNERAERFSLILTPSPSQDHSWAQDRAKEGALLISCGTPTKRNRARQSTTNFLVYIVVPIP